jgi:hypothetical protein
MLTQLKPTLFRHLDLEDAELQVGREWASDAKDHRQLLRAAVAAKLNLNEAQRFDLMNLSCPPRVEGVSISLSHCPRAGGFLLWPQKSAQIGFDLEDPGRIQGAVVERISTLAELNAAPSPALLWVAKEATFKSLFGPSQPAAISTIFVAKWESIEPSIWGFHAQVQGLNDKWIKGVAATFMNLVLGLAKFPA